MFFKTRYNVPDIYSEESRDFQLLSSILDCIYNTIISNQLKINYIDDIELVDSNLLDLISKYLGFFTDQYYPENLLRSILINFPEMIKNKGTFLGVETAIKALQNAFTDISYVSVLKGDYDGDDPNSIIIKTDGVLIDQKYVDEVLSYILPIGLKVERVFVIQTINNLTPDNIGILNNIVSIYDDSYDETITYDDSDIIYYLGTIRNSPQAININNGADISNNLLNNYLSKIGQTPIKHQAIKKQIKIKGSQITNGQ